VALASAEGEAAKLKERPDIRRAYVGLEQE
jgi:hypothetical protein